MHFFSFLLLFSSLLFSSLLFSASPKITTTMSMQELQKLTASDGFEYEYFGRSVAISGDMIVVGTPNNDDFGHNTGVVYLYERDSSTDLFQQVAKLTASDGDSISYFGHSVSISGDTVVVGSNSNIATAYLYVKPISGWSDTNESAKLTDSNGILDYYTYYSVAISGDTVVVGAYDDEYGYVNLYEKPTTGWVSTTRSVKLTAPDSTSGLFDFSVAISGDTVVMGVYGDANVGSIYLYEKPATGWVRTTPSAKLTASDGVSSDYFAKNVAISNDTVVVGAYGDNHLGYASGSVYIYEKTIFGWVDSNESAKLNAFDAAPYDSFGYSVAISGDTVVVGAYYDDDLGENSGSAYLYEKPATGWRDAYQSEKIIASDGASNDNFGNSVAISGNTVVVGAHSDNDLGRSSGSTIIFKNAITQNSIENKKNIIDINASDADDDTIIFSIVGGEDVSFFVIDASTGLLSFNIAPDFENPQDSDGDNIYNATIKVSDDFAEDDTYRVFIRVSDVVYEGSMPKALSFEGLNKLTASNAVTDNHFGISTAIDGTTLVIGAYGYNGNTGRAYIYEYNVLSKMYEEVAQIRASDGAASDYFGYSVAISGDTVVVGAYYDDDLGENSGSAYLYEKPSAGWGNATQSSKLTASDGSVLDYFGKSVAISADTVVVGAYGDDDLGDKSGSVYLYEKNNTTGIFTEVAKLKSSDGVASDNFGFSVAMSGDTVVVGADKDDDLGTESGSAYLYEKPASGWVSTTQSAKLTASDGAFRDYFGCSIAISGDTVVVGAYSANNLNINSGSVYLFVKPVGGWADVTQSAKLIVSDGATSDYFGKSVAISADTVVVGAYENDDLGTTSGAAYLYEKPSSGWVNAIQSAKLTAPDGMDYDRFGKSVSISGDTVVIGAHEDDDIADNSGSAYVFKAKSSSLNPAIIMYLLN